MTTERLLHHLLIDTIHKKINKTNNMALELGFNNTLVTADLDGNEKIMHGLPNRHDNCWLNSLMQMTNWVGEGFFRETYDNPDLIPQTIKFLTDYTGIDLSYGGPPSIVLYKIRDLLDTKVGTSKEPGDYVVSCQGTYCLADMQAGVFMEGEEHAVFYACTALGWVKIDDENITRCIPDPANVLVFVPWDRETICDYDAEFFNQVYVRGAGSSKPQSGNVNESGNSGSIVNNYYMQQYQNSIDATVGDKTTEGGSGSGDTAGSATHNNTTKQDKDKDDWFSSLLSGVGSALPGAVVGLLADKKTEETTNLEDRIVSTRHGTDITTTQSSVGVTYGYAIREKDDIVAASGTHTKAGHVTRIYSKTLGQWSLTDNVGHRWTMNLPSDILAEARDYADLLKNYALYRNGWEVHVSVTATIYNSGCLVVAMVPEYNFSPNGFNAEFAQITLYPHQLLNLRTNATASIRVPYVGATDMDDHRLHKPWTLVVGVVAPLQDGGSDLTVVDIRVSVTPLSVHVAGPMPNKQGILPVATKAGYSGFTTTGPLTADPVYGNVVNPPRRHIPGRFTNFLHVADACPTMARFQNKPTLTTSSDPHKLLATIDVSLMSHEMSYTYLAGLSALYAQYRGTINVHFVYTGPVSDKAKFLVVYIPPGATVPDNLSQAQHCVTLEWDSGLNSEAVFSVPYVSQTYYTSTYSGEADIGNVSGWLQIYQVTRAKTGNQLLVMFSSGTDFQLRCPIEPVRQVTDVGESGHYKTLDARQQQGDKQPTFRLHTDVAFALDRFTQLKTTSGNKEDTHNNFTNLDLMTLPNGTFVKTLLSSCTYFFSDLEISVNARGQVPPWAHVTWYPVSAPRSFTQNLYDDDDNDFMTLSSNVSVGFQGPGGGSSVATFAIPYTSLYRVLPTTYNGTTFHGGNARTKQFNHTGFGEIFVTGLDDVKHRVLVRIKRAELYCPRFIQAPHNSSALSSRYKTTLAGAIVKQGATNFSLLKQAGDVESNPGPTAFSKLIDDFGCLSNSMEEIARHIGDFKTMMRGAGPWYKAFKYLWKVATVIVAITRTRDTVLVGMLLADIGLEVFDTRIMMDSLVDRFKPYFHVDPPKFDFKTEILDKVRDFFAGGEEEEEFDDTNPFKQISLKNLNDIFNLVKNGQWLMSFFLSLRDWFRAWLDSEEKFITYHDLVPQIIEHQERLLIPDEYAEAHNWLERKREVLLQANQYALAKLCEPKVGPPAETRPEPVVVLFRGDSGQGKSFLSNLIAQALSKLLTGRPDSIWSCPPDPDHFDGYRGQKVVIMDDLGQNPDGTDFKYFAQMVSTTAFIPPMAALEDKGKVFNSPVIIATTNMHEHFTPKTMACPGALVRRFTYDYILAAKKPYIREKTETLNVRKALAASGHDCPCGLFEFDCPLLNGEALDLTPVRETPVVESVYELIELVYNEVMDRRAVSDLRILKQMGKYMTLDDIKKRKPAVIPFTGRSYQAGRDINASPEMQEKLLKYLVKNEHLDAALNFYNEECDEDVRDKWGPSIGKYLEVKTLWMKVKKYSHLFLTGLMLIGNMLLLYLNNRTPEERKKKKKNKTDEDNTTKEGPYGGQAKPPVKVDKLKVNPLITTESGNPPTDMQMVVLKNTQPISLVRDGQIVATCCALGVFGTTYLVPYHLFEESFDTLVIGDRHLKERDYKLDTFELRDGKVSDVAAITLNKGARVRDITSHFRDEVKVTRNSPVVGCVKNTTVGQLVFNGTAAGFKDHIICSDGDTLPNMFVYTANTQYGYCGSGILVKDGSHTVIIGIHSAGGNGKGYASCVTRSALLALRGRERPELEGLMLGEQPGEKVHVSRKTKLAPTVAYGVFRPNYGPAALSNSDTRLNEGVVLDNVIFSKHKSNVVLDEKDLALYRLCAAEYASHLHNVLGKTGAPLTNVEAVLGIDGLDAMEPNTAPGLPWALQHKRRHDLLDFTTGEMQPALAERFEQLENMDYTFECQTFLKDEIRPNEKVKAGKTRIVDVLPLEHIVFSRKYLGRFCAAMHRNYGPNIGSAVGCDPDVAWQEFGTHFSQYKNVWAIDYTAFDSCHSTQLMSVMADEVFSDAHGFDERARYAVKSLCKTVHAYEDKRITIDGGLPSGCSATSILNTVLNNIYVMFALKRTYPNTEMSDYSLIAYGDDLVLASDLDYDINLVKKSFAVLGHTITPEDKSDNGFTLGKSITDVTFLKRAFERDCVLGLYKPVMDSKVLEAILSFARRGTLQEKLTSVAGLAFHSGEEEYNRLFSPFVGSFEIPSYRCLRLRWVHKMSN
uniref:Genome polyprotein n=1 Tax=Bovine rhinitis B virus TaxID=693066 RepID=A0A7S7YFD8_9PICO|nr:polyprotein [Bovine rhinitis B virus]